MLQGGLRMLGKVMTETLSTVRILPWSDDLAPQFRDINLEWIASMFVVEDHDREQLDDPWGNILDGGGTILFAETDDLGVVGTGALVNAGDGAFEIAKMGVRPAAQGRKAGEAILLALIAEARAKGARELFLVSNSDCVAAITLYEKTGFMHDADIMARYAAAYERSNVAMSYPI
jgi:ribosomal protein S18 acetylase RimI-like enzyme